MRILAPLEPFGAGTPYAESFHSVLQRLAETHNISFTKLLTFLKAINEESTKTSSYDLAASLVGTGAGARRLVATYHELSGAPDLTGHTLLYLANVVSPRANSAFARTQRWCPVCIHPDKTNGYGQFAHMLRQVHSCLLHGKGLRDTCPECYKPQSYMTSLVLRPQCGYCRAPLWSKASVRTSISRYDAWVEAQLYELVGYLSDADRPKPSGTWMVDAADTLRRLGEEAIGRFKGHGTAQAKLLRRPPKYGYQLPTFLWLAASHSTTLVDVILRPREVLSGVFPHLEPVSRTCSRRYVASAARWPVLKELVHRLIEAKQEAWLPPSSTLSALLGSSDLFQRDRELSQQYNKVRARQAKGAVALECDRQFTSLALAKLPDKRVKHYAIEQILLRRPRELSPVQKAAVLKAVEITCTVSGKLAAIPAEQLNVCRSGSRR